MQKSDQTEPASSSSLDCLTAEEVRSRLEQGWKAVRFEYCFSFLLATVRRQSRIYLTENWQERYIRGMGYNVLTLLLGPWGAPWGLVWTARTFWTNLTGGVDAAAEALEESVSQS